MMWGRKESVKRDDSNKANNQIPMRKWVLKIRFLEVQKKQQMSKRKDEKPRLEVRISKIQHKNLKHNQSIYIYALF